MSKCWASQDGGKDFCPALPATAALCFSCALSSCTLLFQTFRSKDFKLTEMPCGRAAQNEVFSPPSSLTFPLQYNHWFHSEHKSIKAPFPCKPLLSRAGKIHSGNQEFTSSDGFPHFKSQEGEKKKNCSSPTNDPGTEKQLETGRLQTVHVCRCHCPYLTQAVVSLATLLI